MKLEWGSLSQLLFCVLDVLMLGSFFDSMFQRRLSRTRRIIVCGITGVTIFAINSLGNTLLNLAMMPIVYAVFVLFNYQLTFGSGIVYMLIYVLVFGTGREAAFEMLYRLLLLMFPNDAAKLFMAGGIPFLAAEYFLSFLFLLYIERYTKKLEMRRDDKFRGYLLIMPITSLVVLMSFVYMEPPEEEMMQAFICVGAFLLYFSNAAVYIILEKYTEALEQIKAAELAEMKSEMLRENYKNIELVNADYRKYLHDIHKYFYQIRYLADAGENQIIMQLIDEVEGKIERENEQKLYSSSPVLNSILAEYENKAKACGIKMEVAIEQGLKLDFISDSDKIKMFGNLLENALEAASACEEGAGCIRTELFMGSRHYLVCRIENTYTIKPIKTGRHLLTTKKDTEKHGLGTGIIDSVAKKYGGSLELEEQDGRFVALLMVSDGEQMFLEE